MARNKCVEIKSYLYTSSGVKVQKKVTNGTTPEALRFKILVAYKVMVGLLAIIFGGIEHQEKQITL